MSRSAGRSTSLVRYFVTHNPFYAISAALLMYSVRAAYGELEIGTINCWLMMGVLAVYTLTLAGIGVLLVRLGQVWEDVRSVLLLVLLMFLGISISADDLFVAMESTSGGVALMVFGYLFAVVVTEAVLRLSRLRLNWFYRIPYYLFLALFFVTPWLMSPELHPRNARTTEWMLLLFPTAVAGVILTLIPAVRRGPRAVENNGTPWQWPLFPWTIFGLLIGGAVLRSYALSLTFGPTGPIWVYPSSGGRAIAFATVWGSYFLVPIIAAIMVLLLENGICRGNRKLTQSTLLAAPLLLLFAMPIGAGQVFRSFYFHVTSQIGSPIWLCLGILAAFYGYAWLRKAAHAEFGFLATLAMAAVVTPHTVGFRTLSEPNPYMLATLAALFAIRGIRSRSAFTSFVAVLIASFTTWKLLEDSAFASYSELVSAHLLWIGMIGIGFLYRDPFARLLQFLSAMMLPVVAATIVVNPSFFSLPRAWNVPYVGGMFLAFGLIGWAFRSRWYLAVAALGVLAGIYEGFAFGFRSVAQNVGWAAVSAFAWSVGALLLGLLVSMYKANRIPPRMMAWFPASNPEPTAIPNELPDS
ncbi:hypothetical protein [Thalassoroseus pseudoceratinae]|uniref:hypothetical protein n=1 Tax=Thalassoroseus pseudoceratinae TaxID=2713176 RepID=UPI001420B6DD|nr:hypothetical protein [Thalassoroseus pseudoceratinae]